MLIQMRTAHISLNDFLYKSGIDDHESQCPCGNEIETSDHMLLHCGLYGELRETALWADGRETDIKKLLGDKKRVAATTNFFLQTGRLQQFRRYQKDMQAKAFAGNQRSNRVNRRFDPISRGMQ